MNNDNFLIEEKDLAFAKNICRAIEESDIRNRAVANNLAADIVKKYFTDIEVDTESGLHCIPQVLNNIDIADIYIKNSYIDVRLYFSENELFVPKSHFDKKLLPVAYMFVKVDENISNCTVTGFVLPSEIDTEIDKDGYYTVNENALKSFDDIETNLMTDDIVEKPKGFELQVFEYLDGILDEVDSFYQILIKSKICRQYLQKAASAQTIFNFVSKIKEGTAENLKLETQPLDFLQESFGDTLDIEDNELLLNNSEDEITGNLSNEDLLLDGVDSIDNDLLEEYNTDTFEFEGNNSLVNVQENFSGLEETTSNDYAEQLELSDRNEFVMEESSSVTESIIEELGADNNAIDNLTDILNNDELNFSTSVTPNITETDTLERTDSLEKLLDNDSSELSSDNNKISDNENVDNENIEDGENYPINDLFDENTEETDLVQENLKVPNVQPKRTRTLSILLVFLLIAAMGYYGYSKFINRDNSIQETQDSQELINKQQTLDEKSDAVSEAMPVETIENTPIPSNTNEGISVSVPSIEKNLDTSALVSNLSISWEVPSNYITNSIAQRYFNKMGRILQIKLKAELLPLSKQPITNKIMLELEFNKNTNHFDVKEILASSGEKTVDDVIVQTVKNTLNINLKTNIGFFSGIAGNPVLIIRL